MTALRSALRSAIRPAVRSAITLNTGGGVSWSQWIAGLTAAQVLDVDFSYTDRHFQDTSGVTLADDAGENIALASDSAFWDGKTFAALVASQPELVSNGDFGSLTGWSGLSATLVGGEAQITGVGAMNSSAANWFAQTVGYSRYSWYRVAYEATHVSTASSLEAGFGYNPKRVVTSAANGGVKSGYMFFAQADSLGGGAPWQVTSFAAGSTAVWKVDNVSAKLVPGSHGQQASSGLQGKRQAGGVCRYDGADDNHLTEFRAQNGAMTLLYHGTVAAFLAGTQMVLGASGSSANRCWLAITTSGLIAAGVGSESTATIVGTTDIRGKTIVAAVTFDGTTVNLFLRVDGATTQEYSATQAGTPTTTVPFRIGAYNNNGTAAGFAAVDAKSLKAAHKAMTLTEFTSIAARLAA